MAQPKETIVLVHGTFAGPKEGVHQWWQGDREGGFASKLHEALTRREIAVRCWSHCDAPISFWSGDNDWVARMSASAALTRHISELASQGWRCHLVGHSHGGNVIAESMNALHGKPEGNAVASIVTLGTPFLDTLSSIDPYKHRNRWYVAGMFGLAGLVLLLGLLPVFPDIRNIGWGWQAAIGAASITLTVLIAVVLIMIIKDRVRRRRGQFANRVPALALNSRHDEVWQLLHHVRETANPLAVQAGLLRYLGGQMRAYVTRKLAVTRALVPFDFQDVAVTGSLKWFYRSLYILALAIGFFPIVQLGWGVPGVLLGLLFTLVSFCAFGVLITLFAFRAWGYTYAYFNSLSLRMLWVASVIIVPSEVVTFIVRKRSWGLLQRWILGLEGYRFALPAVKTTPVVAGAARFEFEPLHPDVEARALNSRSLWMTRHVGAATEVFGQLVLSASDAVKLLEEIERDASLVHGSYYTDEACINRIANWIALHAVQPVVASSCQKSAGTVLPSPS